MRRFYKMAEARTEDGGFTVALDGRPVRTPAGGPLLLPTRALARAVAAEWAAQPETIRPATMPLMRFAATAIDRVRPQPGPVIDAIAAYAGSDLLCYRAERPEALVKRQQAVWQPLLDWAMATFDAPFLVTHGIMPRPQPSAALQAIRAALAGEDEWRLVALHEATTLLGSVVLALALRHGRIGPAEAFDAGELDAAWQIAHWGEDAEDARRRGALRSDVEGIATFLARL
jgi:chaperone required for assembly of F1-ATPase